MITSNFENKFTCWSCKYEFLHPVTRAEEKVKCPQCGREVWECSVQAERIRKQNEKENNS